MGHGEELLVLGGLFVIAFAAGRLGKLIGLPSIPIYMLVGLLASPYTTLVPFELEEGSLELIALVGLVLLLFNLGLEFDQEEFFGNFGRLIASGGLFIAVNLGAGLALGFAVGWGTREALVVAGITATSSSAIVTKLLIELRRLANPETPMILGITVVEDIAIAVYLAIVSVVLSGESDPWQVVLRLGIAFAFLIAMFIVARWAGRFVSRLVGARDDELFTVLFVGLAIAFGGIGDLLGVTDAIGAFLIGLVLGATRHRDRIAQFSGPLRDVFAAFFFVNFGLALDVSQFGSVLVPVLVAVVMTIVVNAVLGQVVSLMNGFGVRGGINTTVILQNRGEFGLILATLALQAGLDERITPFAGLYVLILAVVGPVLATQSERISDAVLAPVERRRVRRRQALEAAAAAEAGPGGEAGGDAPVDGGLVDGADTDGADTDGAGAHDAVERDGDELDPEELDRLITQAMESDDGPRRRRDAEY